MAVPEKVPSGAPVREFPAASFNALVEDYRARHGQQQGSPQRPAQPFGSNPRILVLAKNATETLIEPGHILGIAGPIFDLDQQPNQVYSAPQVEGVLPDAIEHASRFVVAVDFIGAPEGESDAVYKCGPCVLMGLAWVKVNRTDDSHTHCQVVTDSTIMQSATSGVEVIYWGAPDESDETVFALVSIGGGGVSAGSGDVIYALIEDDIEGATEDLDAEMENADPLGAPLKLRAFGPTELILKYYRVAQGDESSGDPGYEEDEYGDPILKLILATEEVEDEYESETIETVFKTRTFYWPDGAEFCVGEYTRREYELTYPDPEAPSYLDETDPFPPEDSPEGFWKRRYRAPAIPDAAGKWWLQPSMCKALPPPSITELPEEESS